MSPERSWTNPVIDRTGWDPGPWDDEPDKVQWVDDTTDLDCLAVRNHHGSWCGYVGVPVGHRLHGVHHRELELDYDVHGGLTYSDGCHEHDDPARGVCHVPEPGRPADVWWLGFDCGHFMDQSPGMDALLRRVRAEHPPSPELTALEARLEATTPDWMRDTYRDLEYVRGEVTRLAAQLASDASTSAPSSDSG